MNKATAIIFTSLINIIAPFTLYAQTEAPDSVKAEQLQEVTVEAQMQSTSATVTTYTPSKKQKNAAHDATSLLFHMAIPQLDVSPMSASIKTMGGGNPCLYI